jgi:hypothetical protein
LVASLPINQLDQRVDNFRVVDQPDLRDTPAPRKQRVSSDWWPVNARQFQVTAGRVERDGKLGACFVFVSSNPGWTDHFFNRFFLQQGMK